MKTIVGFVKRHIRKLAAFAGCCVVFAVVFALYGLPVEPVIYAAVLSFIVLVIVAVISYTLHLRRHRRLEQLIKQSDDNADELPAAQSAIEEDYQELVLELNHSRSQISAEAERRLAESRDYYTLWAHQIKTPLAAMRVLLQSSPVQDEAGERDAQLALELMKVEQYVEMALGYVRSDSDYSDYVLKACELDPIVRAAIRRFAKLFIAKKIKLEYTGSTRSVYTDEKWLRFCIEQLVSNAIKYTPQGGTVRIGDDGAGLFVEDDGIGIAPEDLPRVFDRGYTGYNGRLDKRSTGIGLYLCRRVLTKLNTEITISSQPGKGTRVYIALPERHSVVE